MNLQLPYCESSSRYVVVFINGTKDNHWSPSTVQFDFVHVYAPSPWSTVFTGFYRNFRVAPYSYGPDYKLFTSMYDFSFDLSTMEYKI